MHFRLLHHRTHIDVLLFLHLLLLFIFLHLTFKDLRIHTLFLGTSILFHKGVGLVSPQIGQYFRVIRVQMGILFVIVDIDANGGLFQFSDVYTSETEFWLEELGEVVGNEFFWVLVVLHVGEEVVVTLFFYVFFLFFLFNAVLLGFDSELLFFFECK
jgi:hypothetical protein